MTAELLELFPEPGRKQALHGTYLAHNLHKLGSAASPCVYANFVSSLDGRIALFDSKNDEPYLPTQLVSASDWRLFQELQSQADCLITHGGYLRSLASGKLDNILQIGTHKDNADLAGWREQNGLTTQPAIVVASTSLDFLIPPSVAKHRQKVFIATGSTTKPDKLRRWEDLGYEILIAGKGSSVEGGPLVEALGAAGFRSLYLVAGPQMLETMLRHNKLSRLYITITHQILGGKKFHSIFPGEELAKQGDLQMKSLYYDADHPQGAGQWFAQFESANRDRS